MTEQQPAEWLSVGEFAALLRLPRSSVYEAISGGRLEHRRVGRSIRIHRDAGFVQASPTKRPARGGGRWSSCAAPHKSAPSKFAA